MTFLVQVYLLFQFILFSKDKVARNNNLDNLPILTFDGSDQREKTVIIIKSFHRKYRFNSLQHMEYYSDFFEMLFKII